MGWPIVEWPAGGTGCSPERLAQLIEARPVHAGDLVFIKPLGEGAFCTVNLFGLRKGGKCAVKRANRGPQQDPNAHALFLNEIDLLCSLEHKHIVKVVGVGTTGDQPPASLSPEALVGNVFLALEHIEGSSVRVLLINAMSEAAGSRYTRGDALRWAHELAQALEHMHGCSPPVLHRDIKAENVLLTSTTLSHAHAKLIDLGLGVKLTSHSLQCAPVGPQAVRSSIEEAWTNALRTPRAASGRMRVSQAGKRSLSLQREASAAENRTSMDNMATTNELYTRPVGSRRASGFTVHVPDSPVGVGGRKSGTIGSDPNTLSLGYPTVRDELAHRGSMSPPASPAIRKLGAPASPSLGSGRFYVLTGKTGSLLYMAPEVFRGDAYNCKADIFSLSILLWELLHGTSLTTTILRVALDPASQQEALTSYAAATAAGYRPPINPNLSPRLASLLKDCWAVNPTERPSARALVRRLEEALESQEEDLSRAYGSGVCCVVS